MEIPGIKASALARKEIQQRMPSLWLSSTTSCEFLCWTICRQAVSLFRLVHTFASAACGVVNSLGKRFSQPSPQNKKMDAVPAVLDLVPTPLDQSLVQSHNLHRRLEVLMSSQLAQPLCTQTERRGPKKGVRAVEAARKPLWKWTSAASFMGGCVIGQAANKPKH